MVSVANRFIAAWTSLVFLDEYFKLECQLKIKLSLEAQLGLLLLILILAITTLVSLFQHFVNNILLAAIFSTAVIVPATLLVLRFYMAPINKILIALNDGFHNFLDNDFSVSLARTRDDELGDLIAVYNKVSEALRDERVHLYQRELLLDTVIQTTPVSLILSDDSGAIIYSNSAARKLLHQGKAINGLRFNSLLENQPQAFSRSVESGLSGLFTVKLKDNTETFHLTQNQFLLNGRQHKLYLFKSLTKEISRQEVNTWKKVIRLISHELNNSLAPISSLAHSGQLISEQQKQPKFNSIFETIEERARYLQNFIEGYAKFARLPKPQIQAVDLDSFLQGLNKIKPFKSSNQSASNICYFDPAQMQQVVINLIKNAYESGTVIDEVQLRVKGDLETLEIQILDRGKGMSEQNLSSALMPFYSTKAEGTGLGLPLCREIVEAHGGRIIISNRKSGGLKVTLLIPNRQRKVQRQAAQ